MNTYPPKSETAICTPQYLTAPIEFQLICRQPVNKFEKKKVILDKIHNLVSHELIDIDAYDAYKYCTSAINELFYPKMWLNMLLEYVIYKTELDTNTVDILSQQMLQSMVNLSFKTDVINDIVIYILNIHYAINYETNRDKVDT